MTFLPRLRRPRETSVSSWRRGPSFLLIVRRIHLYSGLMLIPWVLLYGVTGFLFNHPELLASGRQRSVVSTGELRDLGIGAGWELEATVQELVDSLEGAEGLGLPSGIELVRPARFELTGGGTRHSLSVDLASGTGIYSGRPSEPSTRTPLDRDDLPEVAVLEAWKDGARQLFGRRAESGIGEAEVRLRSGPMLAFDLEAEGRSYRARYDVGRGTLEAEPSESAGSMNSRSFLLRLHTAHTYPAEAGTRWIWALIVDAMALSMVSWGVSGLLMWWPMKKTRRIGKWLIAGSLLGASAMAFGMHALFTA